MKLSLGAAATLTTLLLLAGCSTPQPARDLAAQGSLVVDQARTEAQGFLDRATLLYRAREGTVRDLATSDVNDGARLSFNDWLSTEVGLPDDHEKRAARLQRVVEKGRAVRLARVNDLAAKTKAIDATFGEPVTLPADKLDAARKAFVNLAQELSPQEWFQFAQRYAKEVNDNVKAVEADTPAPAASAP